MRRRARKKKASVKSIINMTRYSLNRQKKSDLRSFYSTLKKRIKKISDVYKRHGDLDVLPSSVVDLPAINKLDADELVSKIGVLSNFLLNSPYRTYKGFIEKRKEDMERLSDTLGYDVDDEDFELFQRFMSDMYIREKDNWSRVYDDAMDLFVQSRRLNVDPKRFVRNYDYWLKHVDIIADIDEEEVNSFNDIKKYLEKEGVPSVASWNKKKEGRGRKKKK